MSARGACANSWREAPRCSRVADYPSSAENICSSSSANTLASEYSRFAEQKRTAREYLATAHEDCRAPRQQGKAPRDPIPAADEGLRSHAEGFCRRQTRNSAQGDDRHAAGMPLAGKRLLFCCRARLIEDSRQPSAPDEHRPDYRPERRLAHTAGGRSRDPKHHNNDGRVSSLVQSPAMPAQCCASTPIGTTKCGSIE